MKDVLAIVMAGGKGERLAPLTLHRAKPALPFGGIYLLIDLPLSNCINSGIYKIVVLPQYKAQSLLQHLEEGWSIFSPALGHYLKIAPPQMMRGEVWYQGTADSIRQNVHLIEQESPQHVLVLSGDHVYKMDYAGFRNSHDASEADVTIAVMEVEKETAKEFGILEVDETFRIRGFQEKPEHPRTIPGKSTHVLANMGVYLFKTEVLFKVLRDEKKLDFGKDILPEILDSYRVMAYPYNRENKIKDIVAFTDEEGLRHEKVVDATRDSAYWRDVGTLDYYWNANMDLTGVEPYFNLYGRLWPIRTFQRQYPPVKTVLSQEAGSDVRVGKALDSVVAHGSIISGGIVRNSVLSYNVFVHSWATVQESVIMENVVVGRRARIMKAIISEGVRIPSGAEIGLNPDEDRKRFTVTPRGITVVTKEELPG